MSITNDDIKADWELGDVIQVTMDGDGDGTDGDGGPTDGGDGGGDSDGTDGDGGPTDGGDADGADA